VSETARVYVNSRPVDVPAAGTALDAVEILDKAAAASVRSGERLITDSRGIVTANDTPLQTGAIFRIIRARQLADEDESATL
jgi:hypothetical protein